MTDIHTKPKLFERNFILHKKTNWHHVPSVWDLKTEERAKLQSIFKLLIVVDTAPVQKQLTPHVNLMTGTMTWAPRDILEDRPAFNWVASNIAHIIDPIKREMFAHQVEANHKVELYRKVINPGVAGVE